MRLFLGSILIILSMSLISCSGGGGGSGESNESSSTTGVRIMHAGLDASPMELRLEGDKAIQTAIYGQSKGFASTGVGTKTLSVYPKGGSAPVFSQAITIEQKQRFSILLFGERSFGGLKSAVIDETPTIVDQTSVKFVNGLVGSSFIRVKVGTSSQGGPISYGTSSDYIPLSSGTLSFTAYNSSGTPVHSAQRTLEDGKAHTVLVAGQQGFLIVDEVYLND